MKGLNISDRDRSLGNDTAAFIALFATALAMGAALAHALELPNKIDLSQENYLVVQTIYRGWGLLALVLALELAGMLFMMARYWQVGRVFWPTTAAISCVVAAQAGFWIWTYPANRLTDNWTTSPDTFEMLRAQWEYSHLAGAILQVLAMALMIIAVLGRGDVAARSKTKNEHPLA